MAGVVPPPFALAECRYLRGRVGRRVWAKPGRVAAFRPTGFPADRQGTRPWAFHRPCSPGPTRWSN